MSTRMGSECTELAPDVIDAVDPSLRDEAAQDRRGGGDVHFDDLAGLRQRDA